ncbi:alpha/beta fold hydrolase [Paraburkholderia pallida]|uniref:Alpha/beta fold hydrolase n=1 Tax=Paraburkholderia pallida TaxID=2547399 RepID=A0A4P7D812_9BURK|nr:alpha/beta hydrolase [Paraburkholderia pallida]QBR03125.1 alpha/beta fold hydrolase [Paraburkholderia pallida]
MKKSTPLVMIHGLMGPLSFFSPHERISSVVVHTPDLIGYGELKSLPQTEITLANQAAHVVRYVREKVKEPCVLLGHSVGGAIAMLAAQAAPECVRGIINVEGNFTLNDAFWCQKIAGLSEDVWLAEHQKLVADLKAWLMNAGIEPTEERVKWACCILSNQPAETLHAMALAVVAETGDVDYIPKIRLAIEGGIPLFLLTGERSAPEWDLPDWARAAARDYVVQKDVGHMMMIEHPDDFCRIVADIVARIDLM